MWDDLGSAVILAVAIVLGAAAIIAAGVLLADWTWKR